MISPKIDMSNDQSLIYIILLMESISIKTVIDSIRYKLGLSKELPIRDIPKIIQRL